MVITAAGGQGAPTEEASTHVLTLALSMPMLTHVDDARRGPSSGARPSPATVTPCSSHHRNPRDTSKRALRPSTTVLRDPPGVARNASVSRHARLSLLAACGPPTIGVT